MITKFRIYESDNASENIRCNYCGWFGNDEGYSFNVDDEGNEICPKCSYAGALMDVTPINIDLYPGLLKHIKHNKPKENIDKSTYVDMELYYKDAYPEYFEYEKFNL